MSIELSSKPERLECKEPAVNKTEATTSMEQNTVDSPEVKALKRVGIESGFDPRERIDAYLKIFRHRFPELEQTGQVAIKTYLQDDITALNQVKEAVVIDKDAIRTHFRVYDGEELVVKQKELSRLLKSAFHTCDRAAYYQGLNSVMGFLHRNIAEHKQVLEIFLGLINYQLSDFCHKEFDKCLVPVFNSAARILRDKHPNTNLGDLERMVNMSACAWVLTWFSTESDEANQNQATWRIWDYLVCSKPSQLIFLVAAAILHHYPEDTQLDPVEDLMELSQKIKAFSFTREIVEKLLVDTKKLERYYSSSLKRASVINDCLLKHSMFYVSTLRGMVSGEFLKYTLGVGTVVFVVALLVWYSTHPWAEMIRNHLSMYVPGFVRAWFVIRKQIKPLLAKTQTGSKDL